MDNKIEYEKNILRSVAVALWSLIALILASVYVLKQAMPHYDFRQLTYEATSLITQIQISAPQYGSLLFLLAFLGKILLLYIIYILITIVIKSMDKTEQREDIFEGSYVDRNKVIIPKLNKSLDLKDIGATRSRRSSPSKKRNATRKTAKKPSSKKQTRSRK